MRRSPSTRWWTATSAAARRYAEQARLLASRFAGETFSVRSTTLLNGLVDPWFTSLDHTLNALTENLSASMARHDYEFAAAASAFYAINAIVRGAELGSLKQGLHGQLAQLMPHQHVTGINITRFVLQIVNSLVGQADVDPGSGARPEPRHPQQRGCRRPRRGVRAAALLRGAVPGLPGRRQHPAPGPGVRRSTCPVRRC